MEPHVVCATEAETGLPTSQFDFSRNSEASYNEMEPPFNGKVGQAFAGLLENCGVQKLTHLETLHHIPHYSQMVSLYSKVWGNCKAPPTT